MDRWRTEVSDLAHLAAEVGLVSLSGGCAAAADRGTPEEAARACKFVEDA